MIPLKRILSFLFCLAIFVCAKAQSNFSEAMQQGDDAFKRQQYKTAINKYFAAEAFDPTKKHLVKAKVNRVFDSIVSLQKKAEYALFEAEKQKQVAVAKSTLAIKAQKETKIQKDIAQQAQKEAETQKDIAQQALKRNVEFQSKSVGKKYQGGIIFYADSAREHGLIAAAKDLDSTYNWQQAKYACEAYSVVEDSVTYSDWRLPTKDEIKLLYLNKDIVGGFTSYFYWSSTEDHTCFKGDAMGQYFSNDTPYKDADYSKKTRNYVRPIRAF